MLVDSAPSAKHTQIIEAYCDAFTRVHQREPLVRYMGNHWYSVNNETVHQSTLLNEISHLRELAAHQAQEKKQVLLRAEKSVIQRLISRLRGL
jgi:hypothetical protein